ncbi:hypothetical protein OV450_2792 [Actinobacteria bacterium OV450]|nr:hypothetical protein OV450_2792 [Actinobacteria bacterium OV450]
MRPSARRVPVSRCAKRRLPPGSDLRSSITAAEPTGRSPTAPTNRDPPITPRACRSPYPAAPVHSMPRAAPGRPWGQACTPSSSARRASCVLMPVQRLRASQQPPAWTRTGRAPTPIPRSISHAGGSVGGRRRAARASRSSAVFSADSARLSPPRRLFHPRTGPAHSRAVPSRCGSLPPLAAGAAGLAEYAEVTGKDADAVPAALAETVGEVVSQRRPEGHHPRLPDLRAHPPCRPDRAQPADRRPDRDPGRLQREGFRRHQAQGSREGQSDPAASRPAAHRPSSGRKPDRPRVHG